MTNTTDATARTLSVLEQIQLGKAGRPALVVVPHPRALTAPHVAEYARISDDQDNEGVGDELGIGTRGAGVRRQLRAIESVRDSRGWVRHDENYSDNDLSAFKESVIRPGFERLLVDLESGVVDGIVCYDLDRLVRRPDDLERLIRVYDRARGHGRPLVFASVQGQLDLGSEDGIAMARILVAFANKASRDTARRVRLKHAENRDFRRPVGGTRAFGWRWAHGDGRRVADTLEEAEAGLIRRTAAEIVAQDGASWGKIADSWNAEGLRSPQGRAWTKQTVKQVMMSPRLAGWIVHKGQIATHSQTGMLLRGEFPPILDDETYEAVLRAAAPDARGVTRAQDEVRRHLLAGLVVCGLCGAKMDGNVRDDRGSVRHYYACKRGSRHTPEGDSACGKVSISGVGLDELITDLVLPLLEEATRAASRSADLPHSKRLIEIADIRAELLRSHRNGDLSPEVVFPEITELQREAGALRDDQERWLRAQGTARRSAGLNRKRWEQQLTMSERRQLIGSVLQVVEIAPASRRTGRTFDHTRASPVWRQP